MKGLLLLTVAGTALAASPRGAFVPTPRGRFIPLVHPAYVTAAATHLRDDAPVLGVQVAKDARCYPLRQIWFHHVVNDDIGGRALAVTYCSMAHTAVIFERPDEDVSLVADGLIGSVLVLAPIAGPGRWPQLAPSDDSEGEAGPWLRLGPAAIITTFGRWKAAHPDSLVLASITGFEDRYDAYDARLAWTWPAPVTGDERDDDRLAPGTEVFGVARGADAAAWPMNWLRTRGGAATILAGRAVTIRWDVELDAPRVVEPFDGLATPALWRAWSLYYPRTTLPATTDRARRSP